MKKFLEVSPLLDRGGSPSVSELLAALKFNPVKGTIHLGTARLVMQRAAVGTALRAALLRALGPDETRVFLLRLGFLTGRQDARFIRESFTNLDPGDAFTAGTRLHMFSGTVRVETVHNDFDLKRGRFSGEFLWHDSVEAEDAAALGFEGGKPFCHTQVGYASGYASQFFDTLIVYRETQCVAQGHKACRVVGKPAARWGEDDPLVRLFRERVAVDDPGPPERTDAARDAGLDAGLAARCDALARAGLPVLVCGAPGTGRGAVLDRIARGRGLARVLRVDAGGLGTASPAPPEDALLCLDGLETLPTPMACIRALDDPALAGRIAASSTRSLDALSAEGALDDALWFAFRPGAVELPPLAARPEADRRALAEAALARAADRLGRPRTDPGEGVMEFLVTRDWRGNLAELDAVLLHALLATDPAAPLDLPAVTGAADALRRSPGPAEAAPDSAADIDRWIDARLSEGALPLDSLQDAICRKAVAHADGNLSAAARLLGLTRAQLAYRVGGRGSD